MRRPRRSGIGPAFDANGKVNIAYEAHSISIALTKDTRDLTPEAIPVDGIEHPSQDRNARARQRRRSSNELSGLELKLLRAER